MGKRLGKAGSSPKSDLLPAGFLLPQRVLAERAASADSWYELLLRRPASRIKHFIFLAE